VKINECPWCGEETEEGSGEITEYTRICCNSKCLALCQAWENEQSLLENEDEED